jgi:histone H3/H4
MAATRVVDPLSLTSYFGKVLKSVEEDSRISSAAEEALQALTTYKITQLTKGAFLVSRNREKGKKKAKDQKEDRHGTLLARDVETAVEMALYPEDPEGAEEIMTSGQAAIITAQEEAGKGGKEITVKITKGKRAGQTQTRMSPQRKEELIGTKIPVSRVKNIMKEVTDSVQFYYEETKGRGEDKKVLNRTLVEGVRLDSDAPIFMTAAIDAILRELLREAYEVAQEAKPKARKTVENVDIAEAIARTPSFVHLFGAFVLANGELFEKRERAPRKSSSGKKKGTKKSKKSNKKATPNSKSEKPKKASPRSEEKEEESEEEESEKEETRPATVEEKREEEKREDEGEEDEEVEA